MANDLTKIEPIRAPNPLRPTQMPSLPAWLASQRSAMVLNPQINPETGKYQDLMTLPAALMPTDTQRAAIQDHLRCLRSLLDQTPLNGKEFDQATFSAVTKLLMVKPSAKTIEAAAEARGDAYMAALDDVPFWAVEEAIRLWYRGGCGEDERGKRYNYDWAPEPHALRRIAFAEFYKIKARIAELEPVITAVEFIDTTADLARGRAAYRGLLRTFAQEGDLKALTFDDAVKIGSEIPKPPPARPSESIPTYSGSDFVQPETPSDEAAA